MDEGVRRLYLLILKDGWKIASSGFKVYNDGRRFYIRLSHPDQKNVEMVELGPSQRLHWSSEALQNCMKVARL